MASASIPETAKGLILVKTVQLKPTIKKSQVDISNHSVYLEKNRLKKLMMI